MSTGSRQRIDALGAVVLGLVTNARSGRVALAQLAGTVDPAWFPRPAADRILAELGDAQRMACERLDAHTVQRILRRAWEVDPGEELDALDEEPVAITPASQLHRARLDGRPVAVKVLRPGLAAAVRQDLSLLDALAGPLAGAFPALDAGAVLAEVRERVLDELDLEHEALIQRRFHRALRGHPFLSVPAPVTRLCHEDVLVSEWVDGVPLDQATDRDQAAARLVCFVTGAARWGMAYVDVEPANVLVTTDGSLAVVDFGACCEVDRTRLAQTADLLDAVADDDVEAFAAGLTALGWGPAERAAPALALVRELLGEHLAPGPSRLDAAAVRAASGRLAARGDALVELATQGTLSPQDLWPARGTGQLLGTIARVQARGDWLALIRDGLRDGWGDGG